MQKKTETEIKMFFIIFTVKTNFNSINSIFFFFILNAAPIKTTTAALIKLTSTYINCCRLVFFFIMDH